jgi:hypothetical protein
VAGIGAARILAKSDEPIVALKGTSPWHAELSPTTSSEELVEKL